MAEVFKKFGSSGSSFGLQNCLDPGRIMFEKILFRTKKLYLQYHRENEHYDVITNLKGALAKRYTCNGCGTLYNKTINVTKFVPLYCYTTVY